ncbi:hypothetical protein EV426DRAFT_702096 [Tirmania nivea]|nr:hypothetical protein EV426DRAFT_702096 [Tirmania nivea]
MSSSMLQYPPYVQVTNTYYHPGAPMHTVSDADIAALASQMKTTVIEGKQVKTENHQFFLQYQIPRSALAQPFSDPTMLPGIQATPAKAATVPRTRRAGTPHPSSHLPTPPNSPNHRGSNRNQMPPPARPYLRANRPHRYNPDERGNAKEQRKRRAAHRENINSLGGESGRRLLTQLWASIPRLAALQQMNTNVAAVNPVEAVIDGLNGMSINSSGPSQMYTVPAPGRIARRTRGVFPPPRRTHFTPIFENTKIDDTDDEMEIEL